MMVVPFQITIEGQNFEAFLTKKNFDKINDILNKNAKKTGYEHVPFGEIYWMDTKMGHVHHKNDEHNDEDKDMYNVANYYSSKIVAENNARADKLIRQLRRFAVEHRENDNPVEKYYIYYLKPSGILQLRRDSTNHFVCPWFDSLNAGARAIETFKDELIWYFTEYKDSL